MNRRWTFAGVIAGVALSALPATAGNRPGDRRAKQEIMRKGNASPYFNSYLIGEKDRKMTSAGAACSTASVLSEREAGGTAVLPEHWYRGLESNPARDWDVQVSGDTATATCVSDIDAVLHVDTTFDGDLNPGSKQADHRVTRYSTWKKESGRWYLTEVSPAVANMRDAGRQTVTVLEVRVSVNGQLVWDVTNPAEKLDIETDLVRVRNGDEVTIEAAVANTSQTGLDPQTFAFCHPNRPSGRRDRMFDDGTNGDAVAGDGIWTYVYHPTDLRTGVHFAAVDVLDSLCLQNQDADDYNSMGWGMPYRVE